MATSPFRCSDNCTYINNNTVNSSEVTATVQVASSSASSTFDWVVTIVYILSFVTGILGNSVVIICILRFQKLRNVVNVLIANLAAADLSYNVHILIRILVKYWYNDLGCFVNAFFGVTFFMASVHLQLLISVNRYVLIVHSKDAMSKWFSKFRLCLGIVLIWVCDTVQYSLIPGVLASWELVYIQDIRLCLFQIDAAVYDYSITVLTVSWISFIVAFILYALLLIHVKKNALSMVANRKKEVKTAVTLLICMTSMAVCFNVLPIVIRVLYGSFGQSAWYGTVSQIIQLVQHSNLCMNPIVYGFRLKDYREAFRKLLCFCVKPSNTVQPTAQLNSS